LALAFVAYFLVLVAPALVLVVVGIEAAVEAAAAVGYVVELVIVVVVGAIHVGLMLHALLVGMQEAWIVYAPLPCTLAADAVELEERGIEMKVAVVVAVAVVAVVAAEEVDADVAACLVALERHLDCIWMDLACMQIHYPVEDRKLAAFHDVINSN